MTDDNYEILVRNIEMLMQNKNMIPADLIRETAKKFGYTRLGTVMTSTLHLYVLRMSWSCTRMALFNG